MNPHSTDRRTLLKAGLAAPIAIQASSAAAVSGDMAMFEPERLFADLKSYAEAGNKQSGGAGDRWTADWAAKRLAAAGFAVERQGFDVPWFEATLSELALEDLKVPLVAQPLAVETGEAGLDAPLRLAETFERLDGAIAIVRLPYRRWSSLTDRAAREPLADALARGASAVILVTTGPTGEALLLNTPADRPASDMPLALLAPRLATPVIEAARHSRPARLTLLGRNGTRKAENIIGRRVRAGRPWLVVSTPRSGWTDCAGERGPGIAIWLALADWMPRVFAQHSLLFVCNSGHEYENLGASHIVKDIGPPPSETAFWLHLGANAAARDYQEMPGRLLPLPSADPYRFLMTSPELVERARQIFDGQPGIEMAYPSSEGAAGELSEVIKAGYTRHAGIFGAHRHHHAATDILSTVVPEPLAATARGFCDLLSAIVPNPR
ncbi:hypothetical protein [Sphingopyxis macrogoltabida]|uniref:PA domain-containing protein n=1 Tax=Sphingopyxis macrogoltabida TaxID=33050 RepID=A0AAC9FHS2_SPHMC|nr:hypothetical protein [Sphingopyxis macrogoltabida]ALJ16409.1 hypothetical protein LH19_26785 [Sphingopyxis macrogoltabida]AMU92645.1 hypothetical protein ATM17_30780 [Sphingopyxis macrogoltabida]